MIICCLILTNLMLYWMTNLHSCNATWYRQWETPFLGLFLFEHGIFLHDLYVTSPGNLYASMFSGSWACLCCSFLQNIKCVLLKAVCSLKVSLLACGCDTSGRQLSQTGNIEGSLQTLDYWRFPFASMPGWLVGHSIVLTWSQRIANQRLANYQHISYHLESLIWGSSRGAWPFIYLLCWGRSSFQLRV